MIIESIGNWAIPSAKYIVSAHPDAIVIGCKKIPTNEMMDFFQWYFFDRDKHYRLLMWYYNEPNKRECFNIYHDTNSGDGNIKSYVNGCNDCFLEGDILELFILCSEYWKMRDLV